MQDQVCVFFLNKESKMALLPLSFSKHAFQLRSECAHFDECQVFGLISLSLFFPIIVMKVSSCLKRRVTVLTWPSLRFRIASIDSKFPLAFLYLMFSFSRLTYLSFVAPI